MGEPKNTGSSLDHFLDEMARLGVDASVQAFYTALREKSPEGYAALRLQAARDLIGEMFREAAVNGDEGLFQSAQNFVRALCSAGKGPFDAAQLAAFRATAQRMGIPFYAKAEMAGLAKGADRRFGSAQDFKDLVTAGKDYLERGIEHFEEWANHMAKEFGDGVRQDLIPVWEQAVEQYYAEMVPAAKTDAAAQPAAAPEAPTPPPSKAPARARTLGSRFRRIGSVLLNQTFVFWSAVVMIAGMGLCPPWTGSFSRPPVHYETRCYAWIWSAPGPGDLPRGIYPPLRYGAQYINGWHFSIDTSRLMVQCFAVTVLAGAALWSLRRQASRGAR